MYAKALRQKQAWPISMVGDRGQGEAKDEARKVPEAR